MTGKRTGLSPVAPKSPKPTRAAKFTSSRRAQLSAFSPRSSLKTANHPPSDSLMEADFSSQLFAPTPGFINAPARITNPSPKHPQRTPRTPRSAGLKWDLIRDLQIRAEACKRAGRVRSQAASYFSSGILYDNMAMSDQAIESYKLCLQTLDLLSTSMNSSMVQMDTKTDLFARALAHNALGIAFFKLAFKALPGSAIRASHIQRSVKHHFQHIELSPLKDGNALFCGHTNLGLALGMSGKHSDSFLHHQHALRYSVINQDDRQQSRSMFNLANAAWQANDLFNANVCFRRFLQLCQEQGFSKGEALAKQKMAELALLQGRHAKASEYFRGLDKVRSAIEETHLDLARLMTIAAKEASNKTPL